jgi:hypothetical protein
VIIIESSLFSWDGIPILSSPDRIRILSHEPLALACRGVSGKRMNHYFSDSSGRSRMALKAGMKPPIEPMSRAKMAPLAMTCKS